MQVEIWSDVVCPWCAIGKARFEQALSAVDDAGTIAVRYRSFELDPATPRQVEGDYVDRLAAKYRMSTADAQAMIDQMTTQAASEGLRFDFSIAQPGNTFDAHRLLHLAADRGTQEAVKDRFLTGYLAEGAAIGTHDALRGLATDAGLRTADVDEVLASDLYSEDVRTDEQQARAYGIRGVPFFVIDGRIGVSGAQPAEVLAQAIAQARQLSADADPRGDAATSQRSQAHADHDPVECADGSCAVT